MTHRTFAASALLAALSLGCASKEEPQCTRDSQCTSANTACTKGVCRDGSCAADPLPEGTVLADQTPVASKHCVQLVCNKTGQPTEAPLGSKTPEPIPCKSQTCEGTTLKTENFLDGIPCESGNGSCRMGVCVSNDAGPVVDTGTPPVDADMDAELEAATDSAAD